MLFLSMRKKLVFIDIILYFFGAFGLSVFLLSLKLLKFQLFFYTASNYQFTLLHYLKIWM